LFGPGACPAAPVRFGTGFLEASLKAIDKRPLLIALAWWMAGIPRRLALTFIVISLAGDLFLISAVLQQRYAPMTVGGVLVMLFAWRGLANHRSAEPGIARFARWFN